MKYENLGFGDLLAGKAYDPTAQVEQGRGPWPQSGVTKRRLSLRRERDHTIGRRRGCDRLGANGVVAVRSSTSMVMAGAAELLTVGTAVVHGWGP